MPEPVVQCRAVTKRFDGRVAVDALDLDVPAGLCFGLLGPNGAGKTTTLKMIYGVTQPSEGSVSVFGLDVVTHTRHVRSRLGVTLQENSFIEALSAVDNLRIFGRYHRLGSAEIEERIEELLDFLELRSHASLPVAALSGGFKRRLAIAMSLVNRPELLILDEPTTGLDPAVRLSLWQRIRDLRQQGTTVLLTTHYMDEAERLCDRLVILAAGRIVADGSPAELIRDVLAPETLELDLEPEDERLLLGEVNAASRVRSGRRLMLYVDDAGALLETVRHRHGSAGEGHLAAIVRPTNLEDVFLRLTGASLELGEAGA
jgi:lipooligosaccharide transport system ATP-binding protein